MSWAASKAVDPWVQASRDARLTGLLQNCPFVPSAASCSADVLADFLQLEANGGYSVTAGPEVFTGDDLTFLLPCQRVKIGPSCRRVWLKSTFRPRLGTNTTSVLLISPSELRR
jgi:hypothetical protein